MQINGQNGGRHRGQNGGLNKFGIIIMSGFAAVWFVWGLSAMGDVKLAAALAPIAVSGALIALASRIPVTASRQAMSRTGTIVGWASGIEGLAIFAAVNVVSWTGHAGFSVCTVAAIVGLHFWPLAYFLRVRIYYAAGAAIVALAAAGCFVGDEATRVEVVGMGTAVLLWGTCLSAFGRRGGVVAA